MNPNSILDKPDLARLVIEALRRVAYLCILGALLVAGLSIYYKVENSATLGIAMSLITSLLTVATTCVGAVAAMLVSTRPATDPQPVTVTNTPAQPVPTEETNATA